MPESAFHAHRDHWVAQQELAEALIPVIGRLHRDFGVIVSLHGASLINLSATGIIAAHHRAAQFGHREHPLETTLAALEAVERTSPSPHAFDVGAEQELAALVTDGLSRNDDDGEIEQRGTDVILYGFGRIGRLLARILIAQTGRGQGIRLRAIVVRRGAVKDLEKRASLLARDSVHGPFSGSISVDEANDVLIANGTRIQVIYSDQPDTIDYTSYGLDEAVLVDSTGVWRDADGLGRHLRSRGVGRVLLTAPATGSVKNIVAGINEQDVAGGDLIVSAASCTTNAISPVLKSIDDAFGIVRGHVETVHSFTNDQNLIDNFHSGDRRGRSAALNMVMTQTGAATAVAKALPQLAGKLTASSIRVPTPDVSIAILSLTLGRSTTREEVNEHLRQVALHSDLRQQIAYIEVPEVVSSDFVGSDHAGVVDGLATIANDDALVLYVWYDNEYGYSHQVVRVLEVMARQNAPRVRGSEVQPS